MTNIYMILGMYDRAVTVADFYHRGGKWTNYRRWRGVVYIYIYNSETQK